MEKLKEKWDFATDGLCDPDIVNKWWTTVNEKFSSKERTYHNHEYLSDLFKLCDAHKNDITNLQAVSLTIFFHK